MTPVLKWLASGGAMILIGAAPATAFSATGLNVAVVAAPGAAGAPQPGDIDRVLRTVMTTLAERGHAVFEAPVIPGDRDEPKIRTIAGPAMVERARQAPPAILDAVIVVSVKTSLRRGNYTSHLITRLGATLLDGRTGRHVAHVDIAPPRQRRVAAGCGETCFGRLAASDAAAASARLGAAIARRLAKMARRPGAAAAARAGESLPSSPAYVLVFRGMEKDDLPEIEQYLAVFPGFRGLNRDRTKDGGTTYRYRSDLNRTALERSLRSMLRHMRLGARIAQAGRTLVIDAAAPGGGAAPQAEW